MKSKTLVDLIEIALEDRAGQRITGRALAEAIVQDNPDWVENKKKKSRNPILREGGASAMTAQVQSEIGSNRPAIERHANLRMTEDRPRRYYFTSLSEAEEVQEAELESTHKAAKIFSEHDLYPRLSEYLLSEHGVFSKRIDEKRSKNSYGQNGNKWLHPDLIGFEALSKNWSETIKQLVNSRSDSETRLWSFEVKKLINRSNVREVYFQALSNSAWANLGYLVAAEISGSGTLDELRMLSSQHGIGVIQLSVDEETESSILIQAEQRIEVDWSAANRLCDENPDADEVFKQVRVYHQAGEVNSHFWDAQNG
jgi:hypothetical protein